jgi:hypothetical protein
MNRIHKNRTKFVQAAALKKAREEIQILYAILLETRLTLEDGRWEDALAALKSLEKEASNDRQITKTS